MRLQRYVWRSFLVGAMMLLLTPVDAWSEDNLDAGEADKQAHALGGYSLAFTATMIMRKHGVDRSKAILYSTLGVLAVGAIKEYAIDDTASTNDQLANLLGAAISAGVVIAFDF